MTTAAQIRTAWNAKIWTHATVTAITTKIYDFDLKIESTKEAGRLRYNQEINAFTYVVTSAERLRLMGQREQEFSVVVSYYKRADVDGSNYNDIMNVMETITGLVRTELTSSWNSTVDFYRHQPGQPQITEITIDGVPVWLGRYSYLGYKLL